MRGEPDPENGMKSDEKLNIKQNEKYRDVWALLE